MTTENRSRNEFFAKELADKIIEQLEKGTAPWQKPWNFTKIKPYNAMTGNAYKGTNRLILMMSNYTDPRYMTFNQAKESGFSIKKGSKGIPLQNYIFTKETQKRDDSGNVIKDSQGNPEINIEKLNKPIINRFTVFNAEQIEGIPPLNQLENKQPSWDPSKIAEHILEKSNANIHHEIGDKAYYNPKLDIIVLPEKAQFDSAEQYYSTALHELGHWTGHESRLNRLTPDMKFGTESYAKEELRAEISSMILSQDLGISHDSSTHMSYVENWIKVLKDNPYEIFKACSDAEKMSDYIMHFAQEKSLDKQLIDTIDGHINQPLNHHIHLPEKEISTDTGIEISR